MWCHLRIDEKVNLFILLGCYCICCCCCVQPHVRKSLLRMLKDLTHYLIYTYFVIFRLRYMFIQSMCLCAFFPHLVFTLLFMCIFHLLFFSFWLYLFVWLYSIFFFIQSCYISFCMYSILILNVCVTRLSVWL